MKIPTTIGKLLSQKSLLLKVLLSYIIMGSILMSVLSYVMYVKYSENSISEINKISEKMLNQSYSVTNTYWTSTLDYLSHLFYYSNNMISTVTDSERTAAPIFNALYSKVFDPIERGDITNKLVEIAASNPLIESVYIYNKQSYTVFSNIASPIDINEFFDEDIIDLLTRTKFSSEMAYVPRRVKYNYASKDVEYNTISVIFTDSSRDRTPESALVFNLKQDMLQEMVTAGNKENATSIFVVNGDGVVISHPDRNLVNSNMSSQEYVRKILGSQADSGSFITMLDGKKTLVKFKKSNNIFRWTFISSSDYELLLENTKKLQKSILFITLLFIFMSILIALFFTREIYTPLLRILRKLPAGQKRNTDGRPLNEYALLSDTFDTLVSDVNELKSSVRTSLPVVKKEFLKNIIYGEAINQKDLGKKVMELGINLQAPCYVAVALKIDTFAGISKSMSMYDIGLLRFAMLNIASETFEKAFKTEGLDGESDHIILIVNTESSDENTKAGVKEALRQVQENIRTYLEFTVTAAIGNYVEDIREIHYSYKNAAWASDYRLVYGKNSIIDFIELKQHIESRYEYPFEIERQILDTLKSADESRTGKLAGEFVQAISRYSYDEMVVSITQLALAAVRMARSFADIENEKLDTSYKFISNQVGGFDDAGALTQWLTEYMNETIHEIKAIKNNKHADVAQTVMDYIAAGFQDPNISVETIAEKINLSPNYLRTIFKDKTGKSISNYLSELRYNKAIELLNTTQYPANRISEMIGFQNSAYFYVAFKKYVGKTPDEYRKDYLNGANQ